MFPKLKFTSGFKVEEEDDGKGSCRNSTSRSTFGGSRKGTVVVGLKLVVVQISQGKSNVLIKPALIKRSSASLNTTTHQYSSFLNSCSLCSKTLSLDKDVYMYKGDQGFCSIECRNRQIVLDDMKELESSTKKMVASCRSCSKSDRGETQILSQELRQRRHHNPRNNQKIHWTIMS